MKRNRPFSARLIGEQQQPVIPQVLAFSGDCKLVIYAQLSPKTLQQVEACIEEQRMGHELVGVVPASLPADVQAQTLGAVLYAVLFCIPPEGKIASQPQADGATLGVALPLPSRLSCKLQIATGRQKPGRILQSKMQGEGGSEICRSQARDLVA